MWSEERMLLGGSEGATREKILRMMREEKDGVEESSRGPGRFACVCVCDCCVVVLKDGEAWDEMCLFL